MSKSEASSSEIQPLVQTGEKVPQLSPKNKLIELIERDKGWDRDTHQEVYGTRYIESAYTEKERLGINDEEFAAAGMELYEFFLRGLEVGAAKKVENVFHIKKEDQRRGEESLREGLISRLKDGDANSVYRALSGSGIKDYDTLLELPDVKAALQEGFPRAFDNYSALKKIWRSPADIIRDVYRPTQELLSLPDTQKSVVELYADLLKEEDYYSASEVVKFVNRDPQSPQYEKLRNSIQEYIKKSISGKYGEQYFHSNDDFNKLTNSIYRVIETAKIIPLDDFIKNSEIREEVKKVISHLARYQESQFRYILGLKDTFKIEDEFIKPIVEKRILYQVKNDTIWPKRVDETIELANKFNYGDLIKTPTVKNALLESINKNIKDFKPEYVLDLREKLGLDDADVNKLAVSCLDYHIRNSDVEVVSELMKAFKLPEKLLSDTALQIFDKEFNANRYGYTNRLAQIAKDYNLNRDYIVECVTKKIIEGLDGESAAAPDFINHYAKVFELSPEVIKPLAIKQIKALLPNLTGYAGYDEKIQKCMKNYDIQFADIEADVLLEFSSRLRGWNFDKPKFIMETFGLNKEKLMPQFRAAYATFLDTGSKGQAERMMEEFGLKENELRTEGVDVGVTKQILLTSINRGDMASLISKKIRGDFPVEMLHDAELNTALKRAMVNLIKDGRRDYVIQVQKHFLPDFSVEDFLDEVPEYQKLMTVLDKEYPSLSGKYKSSLDAILGFVDLVKSEIDVITLFREYPFLVEAVANNNRFGLKLLTQFDSFDKLSKKNIDTLYANKAEIVKEVAGIDPNSRDFRIAMQNKLLSYRRNPQILESMGDAGIDTEAWLNYEEDTFFDLGKQETMVSSQIKPAIDRVLESVDKFLASHRDVIGEYEKELTEHKVSVIDLVKAKEDLGKLGESLVLAESQKDQKKIDGIKKGIANLEDQIRDPKMVTAWSRFLGDIARISLLKKDIIASMEGLKKSEAKITDVEASKLGPREQRKEIQRVKNDIEKKKTEIVQKNSKLEVQLNSFGDNIEYLKQVVGGDRGEALKQEILEKVSEPMDHFMTDFKTIKDLLRKEDGNELDGTTLRIGVWDRNPDVDLYIGNYTDCCVRIDSEHMGEESTIADYLTDLGMQIVSIYDEKKKIPVAAAWCWIGADDDDNVSFVVDNIEANTEYSSKYREQMEKMLQSYIVSYAKAVGASSVSQGQSNNDLVIAGMNSAFFKVGGYNRASGYFLEGEDAHYEGGDQG